MSKRYYTGIGSRETPENILDEMTEIACRLAEKGYVLRSGGANGADTAFENGCDSARGQKEIWIPWNGFNKRKTEWNRVRTFPANLSECLSIASKIHPAWSSCSVGARMLHARNVLQVLGADLNTPSEFVVCWTKDGKDVGGTRTAIVLAKERKIPVYNLAEDNALAAFRFRVLGYEDAYIKES